MRSITPITDSLNFVLQPLDAETRRRLQRLGFATVPAVPRLVYRPIAPAELATIFLHLSQLLPEDSQLGSRYHLTRSPLDSTKLLVEFLDAKPLSTVTESARYAWFLQVLAKEQLFVKFQPIFDLRRGHVVAYECLARAQGEQGHFSGQQLIEAAMALRLTREFDELARTTSLQAIAQCQSAGCCSPLFFINILPNTLLHTTAVEPIIQPILDLGLDPKQIVFELTEVEAIARASELPYIIGRFREWGVGFAIDDLYSNVSLDHYCLEFCPDVIKLDRRLISGCGRYQVKQIMLKSILHSAHEFGIRVLAEGLEDCKDIEFCRQLGVDYGQGFGLAKPERVPQAQCLNLQLT